MNLNLEKWQFVIVGAAVLLIAICCVFLMAQFIAGRRRRAYLIAAARVRSGHIPGEIPTVRGSLSGFGDLEPHSEFQPLSAANEGDYAVVDEQPRIRVSYVNAMAKKVEATLQVQHLDVQKRVVVGYCDLPVDVRRIPLRDITSARVADTGQRFDVNTWVDAVRVARRRRGMVA
jgi:hypothetical protein